MTKNITSNNIKPEIFIPCNACIKRNFHCCKKMPLFSNKEIVILLEEKVLEKLGFENLVIHRYINQYEIYTILKRGETFKDYKNGEKECIFFNSEKGCMLGKYMPEYCKQYRNIYSIYHCPFMGIKDKDFMRKSDNELNKIKKENFNILNSEKFFIIVFNNFLKRYNHPKGIKKNFKIKKDEIILAFAFHCLKCNLEELEKYNILKMIVDRKFGIEPNGEIIIYSTVFFEPLNDNLFFIEYVRKLNFIVNKIYNIKSPLEIDLIINKTQSAINGIDKINITDKMLKENFNGFLLANTIFYEYKTNFKNKAKDFKGLLLNETMLEKTESYIYNILDEKGIDYIDIIEKFTDFSKKFIKRAQKAIF